MAASHASASDLSGEEPTTARPLVGPPVERGDMGCLMYAGGPIPTTSGHTLEVFESSFAHAPHVWLRMSAQDAASLDLDQAIMLRAALDQFIKCVPERWGAGGQLVAQATLRVLGIAR